METDNLNISELFYLHRLPNGPALFFLIFYTPIGLVLAVFRLFLSLQLLLVVSLLNKTWLFTRILLRVCCTVLGIIVTSEGTENLDRNKSKVIISNHVTIIDNVAMEIITPCIMKDNTSGSPWLIEKVLKYSDFGGSKEKENLNSRISQSLIESSVPLLVFPEEATTTGTTGLLKFNPWSFELATTVIPVSIVVERLPFPGISYSVLGSHWCSELFWFLFVPCTHFHIRFLPPLSKREEQNVEEFSQEAQKAIAACLGIKATNFTLEDKNVLQKELECQAEVLPRQSKAFHDGTASTSNSAGSGNRSSPGRETRLDKMALQVKEVIPQVPLEIIKKDLAKTRCVDTTITNILEGKISYIPENSLQASSAPATAKQTTKSTSPPKASNAASSFSSSSEQRQQSFQERKTAMIEEARRRYIAKHGL